MGVLGVDVLKELDDKGVIHKPEPQEGRVVAEHMALTSNSSTNRLVISRLMGEPMATP